MELQRMVVVLAASALLASCAKINLAPQTTEQAGLPKQIWSGHSGGYLIDWTTGDITAAPQSSRNTVLLSEIGRAVVDFHAISRRQTSDCDMVRQATVLSVVGSIVSIQSADTMKCTSGASGTALGVVVVDLAHPKSPLSLTQLFPSSALMGFKADASRVCKTVPADLFSRFAFGQERGRTVSVVLVLPQDCTLPRLQRTLAVPARIARPLALAAQRQQGFLLPDQASVSGGAATTVTYHYRTTVE